MPTGSSLLNLTSTTLKKILCNRRAMNKSDCFSRDDQEVAASIDQVSLTDSISFAISSGSIARRSNWSIRTGRVAALFRSECAYIAPWFLHRSCPLVPSFAAKQLATHQEGCSEMTWPFSVGPFQDLCRHLTPKGKSLLFHPS